MSWPSTQSTLIREIRDPRNAQAWNELVDRYALVLYRVCRRQRLQDADAADVVQNVLVRVSRSAQTYDPDRGRFRSWLMTITSREIQRYRQRRDGIPTGVTNDIAAENLRKELEADWVIEFTNHLFDMALREVRSEVEERSWLAFQEVWLEEQKVLEVATRHGKSVQWVYRNKYQLLERLREKVDRLEADAAWRG